jgi:hypothetical protein
MSDVSHRETAWEVWQTWRQKDKKPRQLARLQGDKDQADEKPIWMQIVAAPLIPRREGDILVNLDHVRVFALSGALAGLFFGSYLGARTRRLQFLAENAHRLPKTVKGWFYYHRERNYQCLKAGADEGIKQALRFGGLMGTYAAIETGVDLYRQKEDWKSTVAAGLVSSVAFSLANGLSKSSRRRAFMMGIGISSLVGALQDYYLFRYNESSKYPTLRPLSPKESLQEVSVSDQEAGELDGKELVVSQTPQAI